MKTLATEFAYFLRGRARQNLKVLLLYCLFLVGLVLVYAVVFRTLILIGTPEQEERLDNVLKSLA